ncbi:MAG: efflux RND transporter periplasmic adaptor subunit [Myxococcota bacterium]
MTSDPTRYRRSSALLGFLLLLAAPACGPMGRADASDRGSEKSDDEEEIPTPIVSARVFRGEISAAIKATSTIEAEQQVTVHAESTGRITKLGSEEGDQVKKGQQLARIKQDLQRNALGRASTSLAQTQRDLDKVRALVERGVASQDELITAERAFEMAQLDVRDRKRDVSNTKVLAPFAGTVTERFVSEGAFVSAGAQILSIVDFDTLVARVYVPEKELDRLEVGQDAAIVGKAARGRKGIGELRRIAPIVDATTGTVKLTIGLPSELVGGDSGFLPGMYAEVTLTTEVRADAVLVPKQALVYDEEQPFVFVVDGERVERVSVTLGLTDADRAEVVEGVSVGDEIVLTGHAGLKGGGLITRVDTNGEPVEGPDAAPKATDAPADGKTQPEADSKQSPNEEGA